MAKGNEGVLNIMLVGQVLENPSKIAQIICHTAVKEGLNFQAVDDTFQIMDPTKEICFIRIGNGFLNPFVSKGCCNVMVGMIAGESARYAADYLEKDGTAIVNVWDVEPTFLPPGVEEHPFPLQSIELLSNITRNVIKVSGASMAMEAGGFFVLNAVMLGALVGSGKIPISPGRTKETINELVHKWQLEMFIKGFDLGYEYVRKSQRQ